VQRDLSPQIPKGFLELHRFEMVASFPDGTSSTPFTYDFVTRRSLNAVAFIAHYMHQGKRRVYLRSCLRPPLFMRASAEGEGDAPVRGNVWEIPAGLVEPGEALEEAAARELEEEIGFRVAPKDLLPLGPWQLPISGVIAERIHFFHVPVDPTTLQPPLEDGSPLEHQAAILDISLEDALDGCRKGNVPDAKTEVALRRLAEL
jgi:ADP-ribose pyrophosphatase